VNKDRLKQNRLKPEVARMLKIALFRAWAAGAVCFFGAWGRSGPEESSMQNIGGVFSLNIIAGLIFIMILCDIVIVNPVIRLACGKKLIDDTRKGWSLFLSGLFHVVKVTALVLLIMETYYFLNVFSIRLFNMDEKSVPVPLEPILFGVLYGTYYLLFDIAGKFFAEKGRLRYD
jgi:hypothetical protein